MSIKSTLLAQLTEFQDPRSLWELMCRLFEIDDNNRKFDLKNRLAFILLSKSSDVEVYFLQFKQTLAQLSAIRVKIDDSDLVQIVMKSFLNSFDYWLQNYISSRNFRA